MTDTVLSPSSRKQKSRKKIKEREKTFSCFHFILITPHPFHAPIRRFPSILLLVIHPIRKSFTILFLTFYVVCVVTKLKFPTIFPNADRPELNRFH